MASERGAAVPFFVTHRGRWYDIGPFLCRHPGGIAHLEPFRNRSVTSLLSKGHGTDETSALVHSEAARYILQQYRLDTSKLQNGTKAEVEKLQNELLKNGHTENGHVKNGLQVNGDVKNGHLQNGFSKTNGHAVQTSEDEDVEDMEHLVNWDKPMLGQVASLGAQYDRWVNFPVERNLRLFGPSYLEELTKSRWYFVPIVWVPVTIAFLVMHLQANHSVFMAVLGLFLGLLNWTLLEYSLHRWVFHLTPGNNPILITAHFLLHGLHHKVPFDGRRLVFPPVPAGLLCVVLYSAYSKVLPLCLLDSMAAGTVIGYGITSALWDQVFGTAIAIHKLAKAIKW